MEFSMVQLHLFLDLTFPIMIPENSRIEDRRQDEPDEGKVRLPQLRWQELLRYPDRDGRRDPRDLHEEEQIRSHDSHDSVQASSSVDVRKGDEVDWRREREREDEYCQNLL